jgi:hypothetical protein
MEMLTINEFPEAVNGKNQEIRVFETVPAFCGCFA